ncbi:MAG: glycine--tRNA ligase [Candidatus Pacebacteria bacterium]|nr:glycine--tRNA ligase [Candidatus Paceibacterota bacterium]
MKNQNRQDQPSLKEITALAKRRGFIFPTSEIYGGLANSYDLGPLGVQLFRNLKNAWWDYFITHRSDMYGLDSQIMLHPQTWIASGHVESFTDPLVEDKVTHERFRADHLIRDWIAKQDDPKLNQIDINDLSLEEMGQLIEQNKIKSPHGNELTSPKEFNILFESAIGAVAGEKSKVYLRGETAQGIFSNFKQVLNSTRAKLPFGIGQIGKSFRNEVTKGQFVFRTLEFEQAEIEYFFNPTQTNWQELYQEWKDLMWQFLVDEVGLSKENLRWRQHTDSERSHYSQETYDLDFKFPFGWDEMWGLAYRTDYDLKQHMKYSGQSLEYIDPYTQEKLIPHVIEPALGVNRLLLAVLTDAYQKDEDDRLYLNFKPNLAPYQVAVFPLLKNKPNLVSKAKNVFTELQSQLSTTYDERGNIGKRYRYQDEIGTPFCVTIDFDTLEDSAVTVRQRNTQKQERVELSQLAAHLKKVVQ